FSIYLQAYSNYSRSVVLPSFFFFTDPSPPDFYPLSLHDALPISVVHGAPYRSVGASTLTFGAIGVLSAQAFVARWRGRPARRRPDRKSTRLNSSHVAISYAVFCLKKKIESEFIKTQECHRQRAG